uniref:von Willebrand factor A domain-containing protein 1 n=1 Tax=Amphilophus citrinellus TaxID=61819 RepID=A0A3Q0SJH1_AMPCI
MIEDHWYKLKLTVLFSLLLCTVLNCCEGDILLLLDSSGSIANYEFSHLLDFAASLLHPFSLGRGHVRVGLLLVGSNPHLEFGLDVHDNQESLQTAMQRVRQLKGDTNTEAALSVAQQLLTETQVKVPKILLWLTDGVQPGDVDKPMLELKARGVYVLVASTVHGNYQVLQRVVTPPMESHLYSVDIDDIAIITEELRKAIIEIIRAERLRVVNLTSHSAVLQWRPVLSADSGYYELWYKPKSRTGPEIRRTLTGDSSMAELKNLQPEMTYTAFLRPEFNQELLNTLTVTFTTFPDVISPAVVSLSDAGPHQIRVSWGPLQPARVRRYTVEYGAIPSGRVRTVTLPRQKNSTLLTGLEPNTQYLVTVSALHADGKERAMSVRTCTLQAALPALIDLKLEPVERQDLEVEELQLKWQAYQEGLRGYWIKWETRKSHSSMYLLPSSRSTRFTHLAPNSRVCVSPIYSSGRGDGLCCTATTQRG